MLPSKPSKWFGNKITSRACRAAHLYALFRRLPTITVMAPPGRITTIRIFTVPACSFIRIPGSALDTVLMASFMVDTSNRRSTMPLRRRDFLEQLLREEL